MIGVNIFQVFFTIIDVCWKLKLIFDMNNSSNYVDEVNVIVMGLKYWASNGLK